jgi:hypothetical protein
MTRCSNQYTNALNGYVKDQIQRSIAIHRQHLGAVVRRPKSRRLISLPSSRISSMRPNFHFVLGGKLRQPFGFA